MLSPNRGNALLWKGPILNGKMFLSLFFCLTSSHAFAEGGGIVNFYEMMIHPFHWDHSMVVAVGAGLVFMLNLFVGLKFKKDIQDRISKKEVQPRSKFSIAVIVEMIMEFLDGLAKDNCGPNYRNYLPLLSGLFMFILISNLSGLVPGFPPPTESMSLNLGMGLVAFLVYNGAGLKEHGVVNYLKHFAGPVAMIAPLFFCLEIISHMSRPFSLAIRLAGNIFGDHLLLSVFSGLTYLVFPAFLLFFGLLVACIQSFVFTLLTALYINMAISHDH